MAILVAAAVIEEEAWLADDLSVKAQNMTAANSLCTKPQSYFIVHFLCEEKL